MSLRYTLSNNRNALDLRITEHLQSRRIHTTRARKVHHNINIRVLLHSLLNGRIHRQQRLLGSPIELLDVVTTKGVDHSRDTGRLPSAGIVKVQHALDRTRLETIDERTRVSVERAVRRPLLDV